MNSTTPSFGNDDHNDTNRAPQRRAPVVALIGLAALLVAGWGLADGPTLPDPATIGWALVGIAVAVGALLIATGARSARSR
ncbi:hypothetical protein [Gordonia polyisoprenivorans]|uniref:hypothetical protein n=1 Tax=Gordonia polyisoprenivorans TaxID=84595 RepID=UPI002300AD97|nr:hypothetical protein [Gordonia polyisoprenivorans]WCB39137.1 hypothetical protein PHA63_08515 [Gordonia polyisoprenivorans]